MASDASYRIFGAELSPYSVKVRSWFRYKGVDHVWLQRNAGTAEEYQRHARIPIVPLVLPPAGPALQDSTPIIEQLEAIHPEPAIHPDDPVAKFISALLEEFGDEWANKWMFHLRWARRVDQDAAAGRIARASMPDASDEQFTALARQVRDRMVDRVWFVGSNDNTGPQIEAGFRAAMALLDRHLAGRNYLFGARPAFGDFGLWGQVYNLWTDPTAGAWIEGNCPHVLAWVQRMLWPRADGAFEPWPSLASTLTPFLKQQVAGLFLPWSAANAACIASGDATFTVDLPTGQWTQKPQKYHAKSLHALAQRWRASDRASVDPVLADCGCLAVLEALDSAP